MFGFGPLHCQGSILGGFDSLLETSPLPSIFILLSCHWCVSPSGDHFILNIVRSSRVLFTLRNARGTVLGTFWVKEQSPKETPGESVKSRMWEDMRRGHILSKGRKSDWQGQAICRDSIWAQFNSKLKA